MVPGACFKIANLTHRVDNVARVGATGTGSETAIGLRSTSTAGTDDIGLWVLEERIRAAAGIRSY